MSEYILANKADMTSVANAIRTKSGTTSSLSFPSGMVNAVGAIEVSASPVLQSKSATPSESSQIITAGSGYDGLSYVTVGAIPSTYVGSAVPTQAAITITPSSSAQTAVEAGTYVTGDVTVSKVPTETKSITVNGTYTPTSGKYFSSVTVDTPKFATGTVTLTSSSKQSYTMDGLDFQPTRVMIHGLYPISSGSKTYVAVSLDSGVESGTAGLSAPIKDWGVSEYSDWYYMGGSNSATSSYASTWVFNADGFSVSINNIAYISSGAYSAYLPKAFSYIALG